MNLLKIIEAFRTKTMKRIAYAMLILIIVIDYFKPRNEIHFIGKVSGGDNMVEVGF